MLTRGTQASSTVRINALANDVPFAGDFAEFHEAAAALFEGPCLSTDTAAVGSDSSSAVAANYSSEKLEEKRASLTAFRHSGAGFATTPSVLGWKATVEKSVNKRLSNYRNFEATAQVKASQRSSHCAVAGGGGGSGGGFIDRGVFGLDEFMSLGVDGKTPYRPGGGRGASASSGLPMNRKDLRDKLVKDSKADRAEYFYFMQRRNPNGELELTQPVKPKDKAVYTGESGKQEVVTIDRVHSLCFRSHHII